MADERIQLTLSSKADVSAITKAQTATKDFGRASKDAIGGVSTAVSQLTAKFNNEFTVAVGGGINILNELIKGGLWGVLGAVANQAIGFIIKKFKEAEDRAKAFADILRAEVVEGMAAVGTKVADLKAAISSADKDLDAFIKNSNGQISAQAKYEVARLHVEALQQVTDGMTESAKKVVEANEAYRAGMINADAAVASAAAEYKAISDRKYELEGQVAAATENLRLATEKQAEYAETYSKRLGEHSMLQYRASRTVEEMVAEGKSETAAIKEQMKWKLELAKFEKENASLLDGRKKVDEGVKAASAALKDAQDRQTETSRRLSDAGDRLELAKVTRTGSELELSAKLKQAQAAVDAERAASEQAAEAEFARIAAGLAEEHIIEVCTKARVDQQYYLELFNDAMEAGLTEEEAYVELQKELNEELEARTEAEKKATEEAKKVAEGKGEKPASHASMTVSLDAGASSDIGDQVEKKGGFKNWQRQLRQQMREGRDEKNNMKIDQAKMTRALKGEMPAEEARQWMEYAKRRYTPDQMKELGKLAMNKELLSKSEQQKQLKWIQQMATEISKSLQVR